ncbi:MAG TPA: NAD-dependent epimerase/dehydratase family protein [Sphingomicrobium sp.]|nr:NAD-dependent epimerase/dehydratase family protein [Sphingomicrobium sp.]
MVRTFVTGAAGFTGRFVCKLLAERGHEVHGLVHGASAVSVPGVCRAYDADLKNLAAMKEIVAAVRPHHVVHLAAIAFVAHDDVEQIYCSNVIGPRQLLESLTALAEPPRSVILASSANIYGNAREGALEESLPPAPVNDYGVTKVAMEYVASLYSSRLPIIVVRPFNYTGLGQNPDFVIPKIIEHASRRAPVIELGNMDVERDFSDVRTVAHVYARLLETPAAIGGTFNICSGVPVSLRQILNMVARISGHTMEVRINPAFVRANEVRTLTGSAARLEAVIGPLPSIPLEDTLRWMLEG